MWTIFDAISVFERIGEVIKKKKRPFLSIFIDFSHARMKFRVDGEIGLSEARGVEQYAGENEHDKTKDHSKAAATYIGYAPIFI